VHLQPRRCYRCQEEMDSEASLAEHMRQSKGCDMQPPVSDTRISREIWANLDALKSGGRRLRVEQKWKLLYEAIFPDDETIPSPCKCSHVIFLHYHND
jgi:hypothetical protein